MQARRIDLKHVEDAVGIRDRSLLPSTVPWECRLGLNGTRLLTAIVVGARFSDVEAFGELLSLATCLLRYYPGLKLEDLGFRRVQAARRIMPEVSERIAAGVVKSFESRGARVYLNARIVSAANGQVVLSRGEEFDANIIVWTAGNDATPVIAKRTDLPVDPRGYLVVRADLRMIFWAYRS